MTDSNLPLDDSPVAVGEIIAEKYRVERALGEGGMGIVVAATHIDLGDMHAIKILRAKAATDREAVERFTREARSAARLKSERVAKVHDIGQLDNGVPYMVMEYLDGTDLKNVLLEKQLTGTTDVVDLTMQMLEAMAEAHAAGIVHRDLKPSNLFVIEDEDGLPAVKVLDFGISKLTGPLGASEMDMTRTHALLGSPYYMSPEQMRSTRTVDARTDIWSIGVILYESLCGDVPFKGETITAQCALVLQEQPVPPSEWPEAISVPEGLDQVVMACLEKNRDERYQTVAELAKDLAPFGSERAARSLARIERAAQRAPISQRDVGFARTSLAGEAADNDAGPPSSSRTVNDGAITRVADDNGSDKGSADDQSSSKATTSEPGSEHDAKPVGRGRLMVTVALLAGLVTTLLAIRFIAPNDDARAVDGATPQPASTSTALGSAASSPKEVPTAASKATATSLSSVSAAPTVAPPEQTASAIAANATAAPLRGRLPAAAPSPKKPSPKKPSPKAPSPPVASPPPPVTAPPPPPPSDPGNDPFGAGRH